MLQSDVKRDHVMEVYGFIDSILSQLIGKPIITMVPVDYAHYPSEFMSLEKVRELAWEGCPLDSESLIGRWCQQVRM